MGIMDEIHEVEMRLRARIDQTYSELNTEISKFGGGVDQLRAHIDQRYSELNTEISTLGEIRLRNYINDKHSDLTQKIGELSKDVGKLTNDKHSDLTKQIGELSKDVGKLTNETAILQTSLDHLSPLMLTLVSIFR